MQSGTVQGPTPDPNAKDRVVFHVDMVRGVYPSPG